MWVNNSVSCLGALPFDNHFEMHLQKGSVFCIWRRASNLSVVRDFGVGSGVDMMLGIILGGIEGVSGSEHC